MSSAYIFPTITHLVPGYDCTVVLPVRSLARRIERPGTVLLRYRVFSEGAIIEEHSYQIPAVAEHDLGGDIPLYTWNGAGLAPDGPSAYLEIEIRSCDEAIDLFSSKSPLTYYSIYARPGRKSFFSDNAYKYGSPPIIGQIAAFGKYVDCYNPVRLDRQADIGQTLAFINPYSRPVVAQITTCDGRSLPRLRIPPHAVRRLPLMSLLQAGETSWLGQVYVTASNRLVVYAMMHSASQPGTLTDHEHLDPFRSDPTHLPWFRRFRQGVGHAIGRFALWRKRRAA